MEEPLAGIPLILRAIDLTIADVEAGDGIDCEQQLQILGRMRERWGQKAEEEEGC